MAGEKNRTGLKCNDTLITAQDKAHTPSMTLHSPWDCFLSSPIVDENSKEATVYFGSSDGNLYALNATDGNMLWKYDAGGAWIVGSAVIKDNVFYAGTSDSYLFLALNTKTGKEKYRFKTNGYVFGTSSPKVNNGIIYSGSADGYLYAVNLKAH